MSSAVDLTQGAEERLRQINRVTDNALGRLDPESLVRELLDRVQSLLDVDTATALLYDDARGHLAVIAAIGAETRDSHIPVGHGLAGSVAAERRPIVRNRDDDTEHDPEFFPQGVRTVLGVPMLAGGQVVGVLHVGTSAPRRFSEHGVQLLQLAADRIAMATLASTSRTERATTSALHRSLLPARLPAVRGSTLDARYVPGEGAGLGGDWYDVFTLPNERIGIVIGDVVGQGLSAAVVMGRLRSALRAYALDSEDPGEVLDRLDRKVAHFEPNAMATVAYATFDPSTDRLMLSLAGHPAPVYAVSGRQGVLADVPADPPVGTGLARRPRRTSHVDVPSGGAVCFYTDGLVERRTRSIDIGLDLLCRSVTVAPAEAICEAVMDQLVGVDPVDDDVAMLVLSRKPAEDPAGAWIVS